MTPAPKDPIKYQEYCRKISIIHKGMEFSEEHRKNISNARKRLGLAAGENHPLWGKHHSDETRKKISESQKGKSAGEKNYFFGKHFCGSENPNWRGGGSYEPYCPKFTEEFKERVRAFFGYTCQVCGHKWQKGNRRLDVHHVNFRKDSCCSSNVPRLFIPLCISCHSRTNGNREYWQEIFTNKIMLEYDGECYLPKKGDYKI